MESDLQQIEAFLDGLFRWGPWVVYAIIFVACFIENLFPPFPGDTFIAAGGILVGLDRLQLVPTMVVAIVGGLGSVMILHRLGRRLGRDYFIRRNSRYFSANDISKVERTLDRWGALIMVFSRFVVGMRSVLAVVAGIGRFRTLPMLVYSAVSYVIFAGLIMFLSIKLVENVGLLEYYFEAYKLIVWPVVVLAVAMIVVRKIINVRKRNDNHESSPAGRG